ncbi:MAG TPA: LysR family transcriptional regulator [Gemmataceae bacterium]|nr:LysR family transcriptional regulator [Gemmataceae bacterium]
MAGTRSAAAKLPTTLQPRVKIWLELRGRYAFGFGVCEMLRAVERHGAIKQAAGGLGKSYRYVWGRIKQAEKALGRRLVETQVGGKDALRSRLTPEAQRLVAGFTALRDAMKDLLGREFARHFDER